jgi:hypothetical protein
MLFRMFLGMSTQRLAIACLILVAGVALLVWQIQSVGPALIGRSLSQVGWGFLVILALSFARFVLRALAWTTLMGERVPLKSVIAATMAGDGIGNLTPLSLLLGEPTKALYLRDRVPVARAFPALAAENFFYSVSVAIFIVLGTIAMLLTFTLEHRVRNAGIVSLALMLTLLAGALWIGWRRPAMLSTIVGRVPIPFARKILDRVQRFESTTYGFLRGSRAGPSTALPSTALRAGSPIGVVVACETAFHVVSFAESYYTLWLITGQSAPLEAFVLDTFNRVVNIVFRVIPMKLGVDEGVTAIVARAVGFSSAVGVTIALVRKGRMFVWAVVGVILAARNRARSSGV